MQHQLVQANQQHGLQQAAHSTRWFTELAGWLAGTTAAIQLCKEGLGWA
jgi:hypothetical protein